jgi:predicted RNA-binding Zn-ribbon protein involved in translation (DUF1610 family)
MKTFLCPKCGEQSEVINNQCRAWVTHTVNPDGTATGDEPIIALDPQERFWVCTSCGVDLGTAEVSEEERTLFGQPPSALIVEV